MHRCALVCAGEICCVHGCIQVYAGMHGSACIVDKVLLESSKNPYTYMIFDVFGTLFILIVLL